MSSALETIEKFEEASELYLKGYKPTDIARELDITVAHARSLIKEYETYVSTKAMQDPEFLDRVQINTLKVLDEVDMQSREAWRMYEELRALGNLGQATAALKLASDLTNNKAKLLNLMGAKTDSGMIQKMQRLEQVNDVVTRIIRETISGCPRCKKLAQVELAEAFNLMDKKMEPIQLELEVIDAEVVDD